MAIHSKLSGLRNKGIKHFLTNTLPYYLYAILDPVIGSVVKAIYLNKPIQNIIILESHNDFDSHGGAFYEYLMKNRLNEKYRIVWFLRNKFQEELPENVDAVRYNRVSIKRWKYLCLAKYIICGHFIIGSIREKQISVYTSHGSLGLKLVKGLITIPQNITYYMVPSENVGQIIASEYNVEYPNNKQIITGYPGHDVLFTNEVGDLHLITNADYNKVILWMPTFRKSIDGREDTGKTFCMGIPLFTSKEQVRDFNNMLALRKVLLILKIHPMQDLSMILFHDLSNIRILDGEATKSLGIDNCRLMKDCDALISDYSSAAQDFLHLDRPIAYTVDDIEDYKRGFIVEDPRTMMPGHQLETVGDLEEFVKDIIDSRDPYKEDRNKLYNYVFKYHDGKSCERLTEFLKI